MVWLKMGGDGRAMRWFIYARTKVTNVPLIHRAKLKMGRSMDAELGKETRVPMSTLFGRRSGMGRRDIIPLSCPDTTHPIEDEFCPLSLLTH